MDIAPNYAGSSSSLMNAAGAVAGILSPVAFGWILQRTGSWTTPFAFSVGLLLFAIVMTWWIRPDRRSMRYPPRMAAWPWHGDSRGENARMRKRSAICHNRATPDNSPATRNTRRHARPALDQQDDRRKGRRRRPSDLQQPGAAQRRLARDVAGRGADHRRFRERRLRSGSSSSAAPAAGRSSPAPTSRNSRSGAPRKRRRLRMPRFPRRRASNCRRP